VVEVRIVEADLGVVPSRRPEPRLDVDSLVDLRVAPTRGMRAQRVLR
jgi:hypothetical protein